MQASTKKTYRSFQYFYLAAFLSNGSLFPLLAVFLQEEKQLDPVLVGLIVAAIPLVNTVMEPVWGLLSDYTQKPLRLLAVALAAAAALAFIYLFYDHYALLLIGMLAIAVFQAAVIPLSDSMALSFVEQHKLVYGNIRLWGAIGFAVASFLLGYITDFVGTVDVIFIAYGLFLLLALPALRKFPRKGYDIARVSMKEGLRTLRKNKPFMLFLVSNFLIFGPILANNFYFGTFILAAGGTLSAVGIAFFLGAGSEAPFMKLAHLIIRKMSILHVVILSAAVSGARWVLYMFDPSLTVIFITTIIQGLSIGLYVPAALLYIRSAAPSSVQATAIALYSAVGTGLGNALFNLMGGMILEVATVYHMYALFAATTFIGVGILFIVKRMMGTAKGKRGVA
ncbi:MFS transporter [Terribacillus saccharophilus]|jgi:MFS transporter, PPP family, 3-phenylpropionic acid transporter|uniref:MFS transporter n=1 Tax=Terribacillus saccharophilus TaxID=361277 RepID=A0ABX4GU64_9BACI|nr:MFS transporter [Terribacillus saccharophilus]PAD33947.1 MFS transporter [Terribacillus saccharophilus]PAD94625.1 MFS transporter [Terribacillus saccharophilus]PAD98411.1 MFS transporter [Terribacillus saccharophilus]